MNDHCARDVVLGILKSQKDDYDFLRDHGDLCQRSLPSWSTSHRYAGAPHCHSVCSMQSSQSLICMRYRHSQREEKLCPTVTRSQPGLRHDPKSVRSKTTFIISLVHTITSSI